jgi:hypothetical protein
MITQVIHIAGIHVRPREWEYTRRIALGYVASVAKTQPSVIILTGDLLYSIRQFMEDLYNIAPVIVVGRQTFIQLNMLWISQPGVYPFQNLDIILGDVDQENLRPGAAPVVIGRLRSDINLVQKTMNDNHVCGFMTYDLRSGKEGRFVHVPARHCRLRLTYDESGLPELKDVPPIVLRARVDIKPGIVAPRDLAQVIKEKYGCTIVEHVYTVTLGQAAGWVPRRLKWDNILCYGPGNMLDFTIGGIIEIMGVNRAGKTSIVRILEQATKSIDQRIQFEVDGKVGGELSTRWNIVTRDNLMDIFYEDVPEHLERRLEIINATLAEIRQSSAVMERITQNLSFECDECTCCNINSIILQRETNADKSRIEQLEKEAAEIDLELMRARKWRWVDVRGVNNLLHQCKAGFTIEQAITGCISIGGKVPIESASGYERLIVSVLSRICLIKNDERAGNFMVFDEVISACDRDNIEEFKTFIEEISEYFAFILVLSHTERIIDVPLNILRINGKSYINNCHPEEKTNNQSNLYMLTTHVGGKPLANV